MSQNISTNQSSPEQSHRISALTGAHLSNLTEHQRRSRLSNSPPESPTEKPS